MTTQTSPAASAKAPKHTPGPWIARHDIIERAEFNIVSKADSRKLAAWAKEHPDAQNRFTGTHICDVKKHFNGSGDKVGPVELIDSGEVEANAKLIAAAPELLSELKALLGFLEQYPHQYAVDISGYIEAAEKAVAEAESH